MRPLRARLRIKGVVTTDYPSRDHIPYEGYLGMPEVDTSRCQLSGECAAACPTHAIQVEEGWVRIDLGRCLFCGHCAAACPQQALRMSKMYELANKERGKLEVGFFVR